MQQPMSLVRFARRMIVAAFVVVAPSLARAQRVLVPMDDAQQNHLKAYGLTYHAIKAGASAEWSRMMKASSAAFSDGRADIVTAPAREIHVKSPET